MIIYNELKTIFISDKWVLYWNYLLDFAYKTKFER